MKSMQSLRRQIDKLDKRIVRLLNRRAECADEIGKIKEKLGLDVYSPEREKQVIENVGAQNTGPLTNDAVKRVYERIIDESRRLERESAEERRTSLRRESTMVRIFSAFRPGNFDIRDRKSILALAVVIVFLLLIMWLAAFFVPYHYAPGKGIVLTIDRGENAREVYAQLFERDLVGDKFLFRVLLKVFSVDRKIKAGKYLFTGHYSDLNVMTLLASGKSNLLLKVTIPEGLTARQIAEIYHDELGVDTSIFDSVALGDSLSSAEDIPSSNLEGYLFPESYDFYFGTDAREIITRMVDEYKGFFNDSLRTRAAELGYSVHQVMIVASIVEGEAKVDSERPLIASVYYNRLKKYMPLEADPTIEYAIGEHKRIYYKDLHIKSPYNTYERIGLPPTPICNPGRKAILAALYPADTKYLYFVANGRGGHRFSATYAEHLRAVRAYRRRMNFR